MSKICCMSEASTLAMKLSGKAALRQLGALEKQGTGSWLNNRVENSHLPFRQRESAMQRFRRMRSLQKIVSVHSSVYNHFNQERSLASRGSVAVHRGDYRRDGYRIKSHGPIRADPRSRPVPEVLNGDRNPRLPDDEIDRRSHGRRRDPKGRSDLRNQPVAGARQKLFLLARVFPRREPDTKRRTGRLHRYVFGALQSRHLIGHHERQESPQSRRSVKFAERPL